MNKANGGPVGRVKLSGKHETTDVFTTECANSLEPVQEGVVVFLCEGDTDIELPRKKYIEAEAVMLVKDRKSFSSSLLTCTKEPGLQSHEVRVSINSTDLAFHSRLGTSIVRLQNILCHELVYLVANLGWQFEEVEGTDY